MIADVEAGAVEAAVDDLRPLGPVSGHQVDITDEDAVADLADAVYDAHGAVDLLFNNAGVTSGGGGKPWQQEPNDWRWCFGVNVFGTAICTSTFVPRMIDGGRARPGREHVVGRRRLRTGADGVGLRGVQGRRQLLHRVAAPQPRVRGHRAAGVGLLPLGRAAPHRPVHRGPQPARAPRPPRRGHGPHEHDVRRDEGDARRGRARRHRGRPRRARRLRRHRGRGPPLHHRPRPRRTPSTCSTAAPTPSAAARSRPTTACRCRAVPPTRPSGGSSDPGDDRRGNRGDGVRALDGRGTFRREGDAVADGVPVEGSPADVPRRWLPVPAGVAAVRR